MKALLQVLKNYGRKHCILILLALLFLSVGGTANALMIEIENISDYEQTGIGLNFDIPGSDTVFVETIFYDLFLGDTFTTEDIPEISTPGTTLTYYSLFPSDINGARNDVLSLDLSIEVGSNVGLDRVRLTFLESTVIPEPTSLLLLGSGLVGLLVLRRR